MANAHFRCVKECMKQPENIRNVCIVAHVDHGKTSISDFLLASNGIVSPKNAGSFKYLDSRKDEFERRITMKTSAISLLFKYPKTKNDAEKYKNALFLINLFDSPGHLDFSVEVEQATDLSDGALVVIDVVEGICIQVFTFIEDGNRD
ncbi:hypothetical protein MHBO_000331 [Bonamia ostreae]|uniref:Tr-type G domain-containing protein n=1 Tax=Bonamia ostreae TaxID=126728 RepID=A0ABV2AGI0_9EUKA